MKAALNRADLLRALLSERKEVAGFIARNLGFEREARSPVLEAQTSVSAARQTQFEIRSFKALSSFPNISFWRVESCAFYDDEIGEEQALVAAPSFWQETLEPCQPALSPWGNIVSHIRKELSQSAVTAEIDIPKTLEHLGRAEIMETLPRRLRRAWGSELQVIVDRSPVMAPYLTDQMGLCAELKHLFPSQALGYSEYRQGHFEPVMSARKGRARRYQIPAPGTLVIAMSDLGLLSSRAEQSTWLHLGKSLQQNQCRPVALIPRDVAPADTILQRYWQLIPWGGQRPEAVDMHTGDQLEQLMVLVSPATRIEPGFLRQVRQLIGADISVEAAFWQHPDLISRSSVAATLDPEKANVLRARFEMEDETLRKQVLKRLRGWRTHLPREIWYEEIISLSASSQSLLPLPKEVEQANAFFISLAQRSEKADEVTGLYPWFHDGVMQRLPEVVWLDKILKPVLQRIWANTHQDEPGAELPPDYDPRFNQVVNHLPLRTFQLYQQSSTLQIIEATAPTGQTNESDWGSWLGQLKSRSAEIAVLPVETRRFGAARSGVRGRVVNVSKTTTRAHLPWPKQGDFSVRSDVMALTFRQVNRPEWADAIGRDGFGLWAGIALEGEQGKVRQKLRWIPPGRFMMGSSERERVGLEKGEADRKWFENEGPQHPVTISGGYWLFDTPVTQALWQVVMENNSSEYRSAMRPVEQVSWEDAITFIGKLNQKIPALNLSLPTEAQWEYACRANIETSTYDGKLEILGRRNAPLLDKIAWYGGNSGVGFDLEKGRDSSDWKEKQYRHSKTGTREVAQKSPNPWGLYDMLGNVWEWCLDGIRDYQEREETDPIGLTEKGTKRVVRGGSWGTDARDVRSAVRDRLDPGGRLGSLGFRCARVQESGEMVSSSG